MKFFAKSDIGTIREENQDSYGISELQGEYLLAVVCDGMGGMAGGKIAAKTAVKTYLERFGFFYSERKAQSDVIKAFDIKRIFSNAVYSANIALCERSAEEKLSGMGTTLTSAMIYGSTLYTANVGDSRTYLIHKNEITQLTRDDSYVQELLDRGVIDEHEARIHPRKNLITKALGASADIEPEYNCALLEQGDVVLLCSDGLTNALTDSDILAIVNGDGDFEEKLSRLIDASNEKNGDDNVTAVLIKI